MGAGMIERGTVLRRISLALAFIAAFVIIFCRCGFAQFGPILGKLRWENYSDLERISEYQLDIRYAARGDLLLSLSRSEFELLRDDGWDVSSIDVGEARYYAVQVVDKMGLESLPHTLRPVFWDGGPVAIVAVPYGAERLALGFADVAVELPHGIDLSGLIPQPTPRWKALPKSDFIASLLDEVDLDRMERDLARLVYLDTSRPYDNSRANLRTRYCEHPATRDSAAAYIYGRLVEALGGDSSAVELVPFKMEDVKKYMRSDSFVSLSDSILYNIVATLKGNSEESGYYVICGHYDSIAKHDSGWDWRVDPAPGADDNGTGTVTVLEAARILSELDLPWDVKFIALSGEELGLWGSRFYVQQAVEGGDEILGVINIDMIGYNKRYDKIDIVGNPASEWIVDLMAETNEKYGIDLMLRKIIDERVIISDHFPFWIEGIPAVLGVEHFNPFQDDPDGLYEQNHYMHSTGDIVDHINFDLFHKTVKVVVASLAQFAFPDSLPDLVVRSGDINFLKDQSLLEFRIRNLRNAPVEGDFSVGIYEIDPDSSERLIAEEKVTAGMTPGGSLTLEFPLSFYGEKSVLVRTDVMDEVIEENEGNNFASVILKSSSEDLWISEAFVYPNPARSGELNFHYQLSKGAVVQLEVFSQAGERIWEMSIPYGDNLGRNEVEWNLKNMRGKSLESGLYIYKISAYESGGSAPSDFTLGKFAVMR